MVLNLGSADLFCIYSVLLAKVIGLQQRLTIVGGTLATGSGPYTGPAIEVVGGESTFDGTASAVTITGYVQVESGAQLQLKGTVDLPLGSTIDAGG